MNSARGAKMNLFPTNYAYDMVRKVQQEAGPGLDENLASLYALLAFTKGTDTTLEDVHDAWSIWRDATKPYHPAIVPFDQLAPDVQELDRPYMEAIHRASARKWKGRLPERGL